MRCITINYRVISLLSVPGKVLSLILHAGVSEEDN